MGHVHCHPVFRAVTHKGHNGKELAERMYVPSPDGRALIVEPEEFVHFPAADEAVGEFLPQFLFHICLWIGRSYQLARLDGELPTEQWCFSDDATLAVIEQVPLETQQQLMGQTTRKLAGHGAPP